MKKYPVKNQKFTCLTAQLYSLAHYFSLVNRETLFFGGGEPVGPDPLGGSLLPLFNWIFPCRAGLLVPAAPGGGGEWFRVSLRLPPRGLLFARAKSSKSAPKPTVLESLTIRGFFLRRPRRIGRIDGPYLPEGYFIDTALRALTYQRLFRPAAGLPDRRTDASTHWRVGDRRNRLPYSIVPI